MHRSPPLCSIGNSCRYGKPTTWQSALFLAILALAGSSHLRFLALGSAGAASSSSPRSGTPSISPFRKLNISSPDAAALLQAQQLSLALLRCTNLLCYHGT